MTEFAKRCKGPFAVEDLVVCNYVNMGGWRGEWVGKVEKMTATQIHARRILLTPVEECFTGTESSGTYVAKIPIQTEDEPPVLFRWAKSQGWYQSSSEPRYYIGGKYVPGQMLSSQRYY